MDYNNFFATIAGAFPQKIKDMIYEGNSINLSVEGNCIEGRHSIILNNGEQKYAIEIPALCPVSGTGAAAVQRAVCNQKNIDLWVKLLAETITFTANLFYCKSIVVNIQDANIYKNHMFSSGHFKFDKPYTYYVHPYMFKGCLEDEIKRIISCQANVPVEKIILKKGIWNGAHEFTFDQFNVDYIQPEDDVF